MINKTKPFNTRVTTTEGYVGTLKVTAITYNGADHGLSHYYIEGQPGTYSGTVVFTRIIRTKTTPR